VLALASTLKIRTPHMLTPLDAGFLDEMISFTDAIIDSAEEYLAASDSTSDPQTMEMARQTLSSAQSQNSMFKEMRGHVDDNTLRRTDAVNNVAVEASY
jgi:hypothetical protein